MENLENVTITNCSNNVISRPLNEEFLLEPIRDYATWKRVKVTKFYSVWQTFPSGDGTLTKPAKN